MLDDIVNRVFVSSYEGKAVFLSYPRESERLRLSEENFQKLIKSLKKIELLPSGLWFVKNILSLYTEGPTLYTESGNLTLDEEFWSRGFQVGEASVCANGFLYLDLYGNLNCVPPVKNLSLEGLLTYVKFIDENQFVYIYNDPFVSRKFLCRRSPSTSCVPAADEKSDQQWDDFRPVSNSGYLVRRQHRIFRRLLSDILASCGKINRLFLAELISRRPGIPPDLYRELIACAGVSSDDPLNSAFDYLLKRRKNMSLGE